MSISATVPGNTGAMVKTGYDFVGWNTNALGTGTTYLPGSTITPVVNTNLYAMWASQTSYTITYNANNATSGAVASPLTGVTGLVTLDTNSGALARTGYSFGGWNTNAAGSGTNYASGARYTPTANVTLYAKWTALTSYAITYNLNGATGTAPATVNSYALATVTLSNQGAMVAPAGKTFAGWNTNAVGTGVSYASAETINVQATLTLYAQWSGTPSSTLTYDANGSTSGTVPTALTAAGTYVVIDSNSGNLAKTGYIFSGWNTSADGSGTTFQSADNYLLTANVTLYANWLVANYTVTFAGNANTGGTVPNSITGISISTTIPGNTGNLVRSGYTFAGWNTLSSGLGTNYASGDTFAPTSSVTLYAKWTALPTYTVTYSANGATGGGAPAARSGIYSSITLDNNSGSLVKSGSYFAGWNTQADGLGTDYAAGATYTPTASVTLYAKWSNIATYTLSYNSNNSTSGTAPLAQTGITSTATVSTNSGSLARLGYRFDGWNTNAGATGTSYAASSTITLLADTTLYAVWVAVPVYTVTYNGNGHTSGSVPAVLSSSDASVTLASNSGVLNKTGYSFVGWNTNAAGTGTHYDTGAAFALSASVTLYAEWLGNIYTLTYNANGSTSGSVPAVTSGRGTLNVDNNTGSLAKTGYTFSGWNLAADGTGTNVSAGGTYAPSADTTLFAKWTALPTYTITYNGNTNTSGTAPAATTSYATQTIAAAGSLAKTSYVFTGWNTLANGTGTAYAVGASYSTSANLTLYAQWGLNYQISYDANGASSGTAPATQTGLAGATTVASNSGNLALNGYSFAGWNTLANGTGTSYATGASITSNSDVILYAAWTLIPTYSVTYNANGATSGSAPATQTGITSAVTISANSASLARTGYVFSGWNTSAGGTGTTYSENTNISISANLTLYARWIAVYSISYDGNGATSGSLPPSQSGITSTVTVAGNSGNLVKSGYSFAGWNTNAGGTGTSYTAAAIATLTADLVLYAKWSLIPTYTITYDANGATGGSPAIAASGVSSATALDNNSGSLVKTGYVFGGWNTQANGAGTSYAAGSNFTPTANITLYAQWDNAQTQAAPVQITQPRFAITSVAKRQFELAGGTQTIFGRNLDIVNYVSLDGKVLTIISSSATSMTFAITEHAAGWATLVMKGEGAMLTFTNFVQFVSNKTLVLSNIFNKGVTASTASVIAKLALTIQRARDFKVIQLSFGENTNPASASTPAISMKDNIALMKLAVNLMQLFPKTIDVVVRLTGNTKDLTLIFKNS
jgi:uncharacterized repeat protein (TIGR02543 family)